MREPRHRAEHVPGPRGDPHRHVQRGRRWRSRRPRPCGSLSVRTMKSVRQKVSSLSGGQRQTVAIARAVLQKAKVVILDEPTAALGVAQTEQVLAARPAAGRRRRRRGHHQPQPRRRVRGRPTTSTCSTSARWSPSSTPRQTNRDDVVGYITGTKIRRSQLAEEATAVTDDVHESGRTPRRDGPPDDQGRSPRWRATLIGTRPRGRRRRPGPRLVRSACAAATWACCPPSAGLIVLSILFVVLSPFFFTKRNFANLMTQTAALVMLVDGAGVRDPPRRDRPVRRRHRRRRDGDLRHAGQRSTAGTGSLALLVALLVRRRDRHCSSACSWPGSASRRSSSRLGLFLGFQGLDARPARRRRRLPHPDAGGQRRS